MSSEEHQAYEYTIPVETRDGVDTAIYDINTNGEVLFSRLGGTEYTLVQTGSTPHYHKDSVNVQAEEVPLSEYVEDEEEDEG